MKTASVTTDGDCQSVRLPPDFHLTGDEVFVKKVGDSVLLVPKHLDPRKRLGRPFDPVSDDFMVERVQHPQAPRENAFE